jgi:chemotaxis protein MotB
LSSNKSIIVKKIKKIEGGHHGGAWKVAYADFVTAMMAFFLLLWLLSMVSDEKRARLSDYFKHFSMFDSGGESWMEKSSEMFNETGVTKQKVFTDSIKNDVPNVEGIEEILNQGIAEQVGDVKDQVLVDLTDDGVRIQITDKDGSLMFQKGKKELTTKAKEILKVITEQIRSLPNKIIIEGHTDALQYSGSSYSNWELSTERASSARIALEGFGIDPKRVVRVTGYADTDPLIKEDPLDPSNRRISITIQHPKKAVNSTDKIASDDQGLKNEGLDNNMKSKSVQNTGPSLSEHFKYRGKALWKTKKYKQQPAALTPDNNKIEDGSNTDAQNKLTPVMLKDYFPLLESNPALDNPIIEGSWKDNSTDQTEDIRNKSPLTNTPKDINKKTDRSLSEIIDYKREINNKDNRGTHSGSAASKDDWSPVISNEDFQPLQMKNPVLKNNTMERHRKKDKGTQKTGFKKKPPIKKLPQESVEDTGVSLSEIYDYKKETSNEKSRETAGPDMIGTEAGKDWSPVISNEDFLKVQGKNPDSYKPHAGQERIKDSTIMKSEDPAKTSVENDQDKSPAKGDTSLSENLDYKEDITNKNKGSDSGGTVLGDEWNPVISRDDFLPVQGGNP